MFDSLYEPFANYFADSPFHIFVRLLEALACGMIVAGIYRLIRSNGAPTPSFPATLVLLPVLIAMVTQVIGDNVARAFSLVGALSIVRFRTVVRDTQDTAYVIFAVVVGMAVGADHLWVAIIGIVIVALAALLLRYRGDLTGASRPTYRLVTGLKTGLDLEATLGPLLSRHLHFREVAGVETDAARDSVEYEFEVRLEPDVTPERLVAALRDVSGVVDVELQRRDILK